MVSTWLGPGCASLSGLFSSSSILLLCPRSSSSSCSERYGSKASGAGADAASGDGGITVILSRDRMHMQAVLSSGGTSVLNRLQSVTTSNLCMEKPTKNIREYKRSHVGSG
ncbi:uncharacterized protein LOC143840717 [Paroedura picta]|uniref:uncharacterized protein LOC143840717 n=1 Tax=Paroedura picta TaxID=143630 RepID=UPI004056D66B